MLYFSFLFLIPKCYSVPIYGTWLKFSLPSPRVLLYRDPLNSVLMIGSGRLWRHFKTMNLKKVQWLKDTSDANPCYKRFNDCVNSGKCCLGAVIPTQYNWPFITVTRGTALLDFRISLHFTKNEKKIEKRISKQNKQNNIYVFDWWFAPYLRICHRYNIHWR